MTAVGYLRAVVVIALLALPPAVAARVARRHLVPAWRGAPAALATATLWLFALLAIGQVLGSVGLFRVVPLVATTCALGLAAYVFERVRPAPTVDEEAPPPPVSWAEATIAVLAVALVAAMWATWVAHTVEFGLTNSDSLWYNLPFAGRYYQTGWVMHPVFVNGEAQVTWYPADASLLHAFTFVAFRNDLLSPFVNAALLPLALLAGWCIGRPRGVGTSALVGTVLVLTWPVLVVSEPGTAKDDLLSLLFLLAAVAFVVTPRSRRGGLVLSGLAAGLAIGTKLTMLLPIAVLGLAVVVTSWRRDRVAPLVWGASCAVAGCAWYIRNLVYVGNPLPSLHLGVGSWRLPSPPLHSVRYAETFAEHVTDPSSWRWVFWPGLQASFGPAWFVLLALSVAGIVFAVIGRDRISRPAGAAGVAAAAGFLVTPGTAWAASLAPNPSLRDMSVALFSFNLRYLAPALVLGLALLPRVPSLTTGRRRWWVLVGFAVFLVVTQWRSASEPWPAAFAWAPGHTEVAALTLAAVGVGALVWVWSRRGGRRVLGLAMLAVAVAFVAAGWPLQRYELPRRYASAPAFAWSAHVHHARIGLAAFASQWPLYGDDLSNRVQYIGQQRPHGDFRPARSCAEFARLIAADRLDYVMLPDGPIPVDIGLDLARWREEDGLPDAPPESAWARQLPFLRPVQSSEGVVVYHVDRSAVANRAC